MNQVVVEKINKVKLVITDIDGVWTDAGMYYSEYGDELKKFNTRDGMGVELLRKADIKVVIITGETTKIVAHRAQKLGLSKALFQGVKDKATKVKEIAQKWNVELEQIAYIGDDINDEEAMKLCGLKATVADGAANLSSIADYICQKKGGKGAFREFVDFLLKPNLPQSHSIYTNKVSFKVEGKTIGADAPCFVIAEGGLNHNGDMEIAKKLINEARILGADAIKFQKRTTDRIMTAEALDRPYVKYHSFGTTYREHREKLEFSQEQWQQLLAYSKEVGILCFASVWDEGSVDFMEQLNTPLYKIASADLTNIPLLTYVAKTQKPIIISTGMATLEEMDEAVATILPLNKNLGVLHCVSAYPFEAEYANLQMIPVLINRYPQVVVGYSGHEKSGQVVSLGAMALGAKIIERHFTLDRTMKGPDHSASLEPNGLKGIIEGARILDVALGDGIKKIYKEEIPVRHKLGKSVTTATTIAKGDVIKTDMLCMKSPGTGLTGKYLQQLVGKVAQVDLKEDQLLPQTALEWPSK